MLTEPGQVHSRLTYPSLDDLDLSRSSAADRARGHAAGYAAGLRAAYAETANLREALLREQEAVLAAGREELRQRLQVLNTAVRSLEQCAVPVAEEVQDSLAAAALELAEAILGQELSDAENSARAALTRSLAGVRREEIRAIRMHPDDLAALDLETITSADVRLLPDRNLNRGDAVTDFAHGYLDATLASALQRARAALLGETP